MQNLYLFTRPETKEIEKVQPERWRWEAEYSDGSILKQFEDKKLNYDNDIYLGWFHQFREIDQSKLLYLRMVCEDPSIKHYTLVFNPYYMKAVHFYRKGRKAIFTKEDKSEFYYAYYKVYVFGYDFNLEKFLPDLPKNPSLTPEELIKTQLPTHTYKVRLYIDPEDKITVSDDPNLTVSPPQDFDLAKN